VFRVHDLMFVLHIFKYSIFSGGNVLFLNVKGRIIEGDTDKINIHKPMMVKIKGLSIN
jgi:hypothetical protein